MMMYYTLREKQKTLSLNITHHSPHECILCQSILSLRYKMSGMTSALGAKKSSRVRNSATVNTHHATDSTKYTARIRAIYQSKAYDEDTPFECNTKASMDAIFPCIFKLEGGRSRIQPPR
jgi:hypothetical protein